MRRESPTDVCRAFLFAHPISDPIIRIGLKGFGFIISPDHEEDLFAHYSTIVVDGYKSLRAGQQVSFDTSPAENGIHAINIKPIE